MKCTKYQKIKSFKNLSRGMLKKIQRANQQSRNDHQILKLVPK